MKVKCPHCGKSVVVDGFGRRPLNIPVNKVCDTLQLRRSVTAAANELGCSRAYIYKILKASQLKPEDVIKVRHPRRHATRGEAWRQSLEYKGGEEEL